MSFLDNLWDYVKTVQEGFDGWVAKNMSRQTQNIIIISVIFAMVLHLVYSKRKLTREYKEKQKQEAEEKSKSQKKKVK